MGSVKRGKKGQSFSDPYDDYDDEYDEEMDELDDFDDLSRDFYSTDWEDPSGKRDRLSTRRKIERRNELKELYSQFDDWEEFEFGNDW